MTKCYDIYRDQTYVQVADYDHDITARYSGGAYIELGSIGEHGEWIAGDVINVYDAERGEPMIRPSIPAVIKAVQKWVRENTEYRLPRRARYAPRGNEAHR